MKLVLAKWTADRVSAGNLPEWAAQEAMNYLKQRLHGHGGIIVLNTQGQFGIAHNTPRMAWAHKTVEKENIGRGTGKFQDGAVRAEKDDFAIFESILLRNPNKTCSADRQVAHVGSKSPVPSQICDFVKPVAGLSVFGIRNK